MYSSFRQVHVTHYNVQQQADTVMLYISCTAVTRVSIIPT